MASPVSVQFRNSILTAVLIASYGCPDVRSATLPEGVWVREGYTLSIAEDSIQKPRFMAFDDKGTLVIKGHESRLLDGVLCDRQSVSFPDPYTFRKGCRPYIRAPVRCDEDGRENRIPELH